MRIRPAGCRFVALLFLASTAAAQSETPPAAECIGCKVDFAAIRALYSDAEWKKLEAGKVLTGRENLGDQQAEVTSSVLVDRPAAQTWVVLIDFESRPKYISSAEKIEIVRKEGNRLWVEERIGVLFIDIYYTVINTLFPEEGIMRWELDKSVKHDIADTTGQWQIVPLPDGGRSLIRYRSKVDTGQPVPKFIETALTESSLPKLMVGLRDETARRYSRPRTPPSISMP